MSAIDELNLFAEKTREMREETVARAKRLIRPALLSFMQEQPTIVAIRWTQYTPYFNDGDACVFSVYEPTFFTTKPEEGEDSEESGGFDTYSDSYDYAAKYNSLPSREVWNACKSLSTTLQSLETEMSVVFGDGVKVIVTKDGVEVEEYDHD